MVFPETAPSTASWPLYLCHRERRPTFEVAKMLIRSALTAEQEPTYCRSFAGASAINIPSLYEGGGSAYVILAFNTRPSQTPAQRRIDARHT